MTVKTKIQSVGHCIEYSLALKVTETKPEACLGSEIRWPMTPATNGRDATLIVEQIPVSPQSVSP